MWTTMLTDWIILYSMGLLPDTQNCGLRMRQEFREPFPRHRPLINDPDMHHGTCATHVPWCMWGSLIHVGGENVPAIPGACATRNFPYLIRGPWVGLSTHLLTSAWDWCLSMIVKVLRLWKVLPVPCQLSIGPIETNFSEISITRAPRR